MHASHNYLESILSWGNIQLDETILNPEDCWALRKGSMYHVKDPKKELICSHSKNLGVNSPSYTCIPLLVQSDVIGLLYLEWPFNLFKEEYLNQLNLAISLSKQIALSLSNIMLRETLRNQSIRDKLTGLYNRRYLEETFDRELQRNKRKSATFALLMLDVDHFKNFNDTLGHEAGDLVLQSLGQVFINTIRGEDIVCRFGGEEFVMVLSEISSAEALERAQYLHEKVNQIHLKMAENLIGPITLSIGIAMYPEHGTTLEALIHASDLALYKAKNTGRNKTVFYDEHFG
jgi:diguanylate cyclase (GGDEF)-like protein